MTKMKFERFLKQNAKLCIALQLENKRKTSNFEN